MVCTQTFFAKSAIGTLQTVTIGILMMNKYRVYLHSKPGYWEFYKGHVDVFAEDDTEAIKIAIRRLRSTSFPDRPLSAWVMDKVERLT